LIEGKVIRKQPTRWQKFQSRMAEFASAYQNLPKAFALVWASSKWMTLLMVVLTLAFAFMPASQAWVGKLIVDQVVALMNAGADPMAGFQLMLPLLALEFGLIAISAVGGQARSLVESVINAKLNLHINEKIIHKALELDLTYFEDSEFYDKLQNARREADRRALGIVMGSFNLIQSLITLISFAVLLVRFSPWLTLVLFVAVLPSFLAQEHFARANFKLLSRRAPKRRQMGYFEQLLTVDSYVKEIKLFGVGHPLLQRYQELFQKFFREDMAMSTKRSATSVALSLLSSLSYYFAYGWIILRTIGQTITLGDMTLYLGVFRQSQGTVSSLFRGVADLYENSLFMSNLFTFLNLEPQMAPAADMKALPARLQGGVEFRNVSFRYPGREEYALRNVNLTIRPGEKIALVGANGAGKTTMIKLLTRLYDPTEGQILVDGIDLREVSVATWQEKIGVIFQDFVRYQMTVGENIGLGQVSAMRDRERIAVAAEKGGAAPVVAELPQGYDTMLGKWFQKGHELSGGEWQKVAISRAFMRDAEILVLDEPTAALDAQQEYQIFQRFRELTADKMAVLISHRFSTVRMADRIAVISDGTIAEWGSHEELMGIPKGLYQHLFNIQAQGYR
jgi:ATP-binding cassette, subfamily B, bacterial